MSEFPREVWGVGVALISAVGAAFAALLGYFAVKIKTRVDDARVSRDLRDELREDNVKLREDNEKLRDRVTTLEELVSQLVASDKARALAAVEWEYERRSLKRGLDKRDEKIARMESRLVQYEHELDVLREQFGDFSEATE